MIELAWKLFQTTGEVKYYLLAKRLEGECNAIKKNDRDCNK